MFIDNKQMSIKLIKCPRCEEYQAYITEAEDDPKHRKILQCAFCRYQIPLKDLHGSPYNNNEVFKN